MPDTITLRTPTPQEIEAIIESAYQYMQDIDPYDYDTERDSTIAWVKALVITVHEQTGKPPVITAYHPEDPTFHQLYRMMPDGKAQVIHQHENMRMPECYL